MQWITPLHSFPNLLDIRVLNRTRCVILIKTVPVERMKPNVVSVVRLKIIIFRHSRGALMKLHPQNMCTLITIIILYITHRSKYFWVSLYFLMFNFLYPYFFFPILWLFMCLTLEFLLLLLNGMSEWLSPGDFSHTEGSSGWTDTSIGTQGWTLFQNSTSKGTNTHCQCHTFFIEPVLNHLKQWQNV